MLKGGEMKIVKLEKVIGPTSPIRKRDIISFIQVLKIVL